MPDITQRARERWEAGEGDYALLYIEEALKELDGIEGAVAGRQATGLVLPPIDEDPAPEKRRALYIRWLERQIR